MRMKKASTAIKLAVALVCLASISLTPSASAASSTKFTDESLQAYEQQLAGGQIAVARFSEKAHAMHLTLKDGRHMRVVYRPRACRCPRPRSRQATTRSATSPRASSWS
jgi:hypothetical protein